MSTSDHVNHPSHYTAHPSGVECVQITEHMNFCLGNAMKYLWRAGLKGDAVEDLKKAKWYIEREISRLGCVLFSSEQLKIKIVVVIIIQWGTRCRPPLHFWNPRTIVRWVED